MIQVIPFPSLPTWCPCCEQRIVYGWLDTEVCEPRETEPDCLRIRLIPRADQPFFCPACETRILN